MALKKDDNSPAGNAARASIAAQQRQNRRANRGSGATADWTNADPVLISSCISTLTAYGCAIQFGYTQDGSSFVVRIVGDGEPFNEYVRPTEDINLYLTGLIDDYRK